MTCMKFKGHLKLIRGQIVIMPYDFQTLSEEPLIQIGDNHILNRGQMLIEVKRIKVCFTTTGLGLKHHQTVKTVRAF